MQISLRATLLWVALFAMLMASLHNPLLFAVSIPLLAAAISIGEDRFLANRVNPRSWVFAWAGVLLLPLALVLAGLLVPVVR